MKKKNNRLKKYEGNATFLSELPSPAQIVLDHKKNEANKDGPAVTVIERDAKLS
jgi:hypothetical protein